MRQIFLRSLLWLWDCDLSLIQLQHVLCRLLLWDLLLIQLHHVLCRLLLLNMLLIQLHHVLCRLLLWDCDDRSYSFYVEVSTDQQKWHRVADKSSEACK